MGLEAFNFTDDLQRVLFYTMMFVPCILDFLFCMMSHSVTTTVTQRDNNNDGL